MKKRTFFALFFETYRFWQFKAVPLPPILKLRNYERTNY